jgi:hypothetical protein
MALDVGDLAGKMFDAAFAVLMGKTPGIANYLRGECAKLAHTFATIEAEQASGEISLDEARLLLEMQTSASRSVLLTSEGLGLLAAEQAINAALDAVRSAVNAALPFALL